MSGERSESQSLKNRADILRGLATSGVLVEARGHMREAARAGVTPMQTVSQGGLGERTPTQTVREPGADQTGSPARAQELAKPGTQVELPAAGFGAGGPAKGQEVARASSSEVTQDRPQSAPLKDNLAARGDTVQEVARQFRQPSVQQKNMGSGPSGPTASAASPRDRGDGRTR